MQSCRAARRGARARAAVRAAAARAPRRAAARAFARRGALRAASEPSCVRSSRARSSRCRARRGGRPTDGVEARTSAARSKSGVSCSWPTAETTGTGQSATARTSRSSENGSRSSKLPPPRASTITSAPRAQRSPIAVAIAAAARGALDVRLGDERRAPAGSACVIAVSTSRFAAASLPVTSPIRRGIRGSGRLRSAANSPSAASFCFSRSSAARWAPSP